MTGRACVICGSPASGEVTGAIGDVTGPLCDDCAWWADGNVTHWLAGSTVIPPQPAYPGAAGMGRTVYESVAASPLGIADLAECSECGAPMSKISGLWDARDGSACPSGSGHIPQDAR